MQAGAIKDSKYSLASMRFTHARRFPCRAKAKDLSIFHLNPSFSQLRYLTKQVSAVES